MQYLLGLDVETSGLDENKGHILEVGCILFCLQNKAIIAQASTLLLANENPVEHINNIPVPLLEATPPEIETAILGSVLALMMKADIIVAHNARFDRAWIEKNELLGPISKNKKWLCTRQDIRWPGMGNLKLESIAARMNVPYVDAHRALPDVGIMFECLKRLPDLDEQIARKYPTTFEMAV